MPFTHDQRLHHTAIHILDYLRRCEYSQNDELLTLDIARGLHFEQFKANTTDVLCTAGVSLCATLQTYEIAADMREACHDDAVVTADATGRMPLMVPAPAVYSYNAWMWCPNQQQPYVPVTITTWQPLVREGV